MTTAPNTTPVNDISVKELPLIDDIRLLGQVLGDTIREQEGEKTFELIETIRKLSVAFERHADPDAGQQLGAGAAGLTADQAMAVLRAFTYFSHLANIAEDRHYIRRRAARGMQQPQTRETGSLAATFERLAMAGFGAEAIAEILDRSLVSPVLTAHPTEVQRKSQRDAERSIAQLLLERDTLASERERKHNDMLLRARIAQLWQTRLLRYSRLSVHDEIENALGLLPNDIPAANSATLCRARRPSRGIQVASFFRMASWIGGDRDGNPNVNAQTLILALRRQCEVALRHYLTEIHLLGGELSSTCCSSPVRRNCSSGRSFRRQEPAARRRTLSACLDRHLR